MGGRIGGERVSRRFAEYLEGAGWDGRRATTFRGMSVGVAAWAAVAVKQDDKSGQTGCDKSGGLVRRGRQVKCAAGGGGDGDRAGGEWVSRHFAKCLEGVRRDGRRATTFRGMSVGEDAADRAETEMTLYRRDCAVCP